MSMEELVKVARLIRGHHEELRAAKSLVYRLLGFAATAARLVGGGEAGSKRAALRAALYVNYVYMWPRRRDQLERIAELLNEHGAYIPLVGEENVPRAEDVVEWLAKSYAQLYLVYLASRIGVRMSA